jgi:hypothetical protein
MTRRPLGDIELVTAWCPAEKAWEGMRQEDFSSSQTCHSKPTEAGFDASR